MTEGWISLTFILSVIALCVTWCFTIVGIVDEIAKWRTEARLWREFIEGEERAWRRDIGRHRSRVPSMEG